MKKIHFAAGLLILVCMVFSCQTLRVQEPVIVENAKSPAGVYLAETSTPNGVIQFTMTINEDGTGKLESMMGNAEFSDAVLKGNSFNFNMILNTQMGEMALAFKGAVDGDKINGTIGTQMGSLPFSGQRKL